mmetsp:Transcript_16822/g.32855  ORF Transcript_16822/g.32855 Transcript_16822/m.32855 type:complete len:161 (-) Transcript_16822:30-512(-)
MRIRVATLEEPNAAHFLAGPVNPIGPPAAEARCADAREKSLRLSLSTPVFVVLQPPRRRGVLELEEREGADDRDGDEEEKVARGVWMTRQPSFLSVLSMRCFGDGKQTNRGIHAAPRPNVRRCGNESLRRRQRLDSRAISSPAGPTNAGETTTPRGWPCS